MSLANSDDLFGGGGGGELSEIPMESDAGMMEGGESTAPQTPPAPQYRKQGFGIYTMMLLLSFLFLLIATILFFVEAGKF